jgi:DNA-binding response OmpR family regulator
MDLNMPKLDGSDAIKLIRAISKNVVIIAETAKSLSEITEETSGYEINDYFFKPYSRHLSFPFHSG